MALTGLDQDVHRGAVDDDWTALAMLSEEQSFVQERREDRNIRIRNDARRAI